MQIHIRSPRASLLPCLTSARANAILARAKRPRTAHNLRARRSQTKSSYSSQHRTHLAFSNLSRICQNTAYWRFLSTLVSGGWTGSYHAYCHQARSPETRHIRVDTQERYKYHQSSSTLSGSDGALSVTLRPEPNYSSSC